MLRKLLSDEDVKTATLIVAFFAVFGFLVGLMWSVAHAALSGVMGAGAGVIIVIILVQLSSERDDP